MVRKLMVNILAGVTLAGFALADGNVVPATDNVGTIGRSGKMWNNIYVSNVTVKAGVVTNLSVEALTASNFVTTAATVNGKPPVVSTNTSWKLMIVDGTFTNGQVQVAWPTAFGSAPRGVSLTWIDDVTGKAHGGSNALGAVSMTVTSFIPKIDMPIDVATNLYFMVIGQAP